MVMSFEDMQWADSSAPGLRRVPARLVEKSRHLRPHPVVARDRRASAELGSGQPELHLDLPGAALARRMRELVTGLVPGLPGRRLRPDPAPLRGRPALRGRDRPDAHRQRAADACRRQLRARRADRSPRHPRDPAGSHRGAPRRAVPQAERRLLQEAAVVGKTFSKVSLAALLGEPPETLDEMLSSLVKKRSSPSRPTHVSRPRPVRVPAGPRPGRRLRDAPQARPQAEAPRCRRSPARGLGERRGRDRRSRRLSLPRGVPARSRCPRRRGREVQGQGASDASW